MRTPLRQRNARLLVDDDEQPRTEKSAVSATDRLDQGRTHVAKIHIEDGIIKITELDIQDPKAATVLAAYPPVRWAEITRRAVKIGLGYLKGGEKD